MLPSAICRCLILATVLCCAAEAAEPVRVEIEQQHMGTTFRIVAYAADEGLARQASERALARIGELDRRLSDYQSTSELMQVCQSAPHAQPVEVSEELWRVLRQANEISCASDGAFDVTVGQLTRLWRRARRQRELPARELLAPALDSVGYAKVLIDPGLPRVQLTQADMRIDLGGIAKGFACEEALRLLRSAGITQALIDAGGGMTLGSPPPGQQGWKIGIASLIEGEPPTDYLLLHDCSVATSGDLWQFVEINGVRYSHILDPQTGMGLTTRISATVVAGDGATADALATAACVLGPERGLELVDRFAGQAVISVLESPQHVQRVISPRLHLSREVAAPSPE